MEWNSDRSGNEESVDRADRPNAGRDRGREEKRTGLEPLDPSDRRPEDDGICAGRMMRNEPLQGLAAIPVTRAIRMCRALIGVEVER